MASRLAEDGENVVSLAVRRPTPALTFQVAGRKDDVAAPRVLLVEQVEALEQVDWVVVATKAHDSAHLGPWLTHPSCTTANVAVAQNGIEHAARLRHLVAPERVVPLIVTYGAERPVAGRIVQTLAGTVHVPDDELGRCFAALASHTSLDVEVAPDFALALWTKLAWNLTGNSLSTLTNLPVREVALRPELRDLALRLLAEVRVVAAAHAVQLERCIENDILDTFGSYPETVRSSMWQDRQAGRTLEHDAISGAVVRHAALVGVDAPYSRTVTSLLETLSETISR